MSNLERQNKARIAFYMSNQLQNNSSKHPDSAEALTSHENWQSVEFFFSGDPYFKSALVEIAKAEKEIILESYIFNMDPIGLRILQALSEARRRGVKIMLLIDGVGSFNWLAPLKDYCLKNEIPLRVFHPLPVRVRSLRKMSWRHLRKLLFLFRRINKRNHRKIILIDEKIAYLGSFNITQVHSKEYMGGQAWRDTGVRLEGPALKQLRNACEEAWRKSRLFSSSLTSTFIKRKKRRKVMQAVDFPLRLNSKMRWRYKLLRNFNQHIKKAQKRVLITNAYFLPRRSVLRSLRRAAKRGVYVALCLPSLTDVPALRWASRSLFHRLMKDGVNIYEYQPSILHAKTLIIDDWATVGSHNLNHRSFTHDLEVEAVFTEKIHIDPLLHQWDEDIRKSRKITQSDLGKMPLWQRVFARLAYWLRYWI